MGTCVEKLPHNCSAYNSDLKDTSDALQVFEDEDGGYNGYCYACGTFVGDPYHDKPADYKPVVQKRSKEEIAAELYQISQYPVVGLPDRELRRETLEYFGYSMGVSLFDGETTEILYRP